MTMTIHQEQMLKTYEKREQDFIKVMEEQQAEIAALKEQLAKPVIEGKVQWQRDIVLAELLRRTKDRLSFEKVTELVGSEVAASEPLDLAAHSVLCNDDKIVIYLGRLI